MSAESLVNDLIVEQSARAQEAQDAAIQYGNEAQTAAISIVSLPPPQFVPIPDVDIPLPEDTNAVAEFIAAYTGAFDDYGAEFATQWQTFLDTYFPEVDGCIKLLSDAWICDTIENGQALPVAVENSIWDRARGREVELAQQATEQAIDEWAMRGFQLPSGILAARVRAAQQDQITKSATINREAAIDQAKRNWEAIQFAVNKAIELRLGAFNAATNYVRTWFLVPQTAIEKAKAQTDTRFKFLTATASYYNAIIGAAELELRAYITNAQVSVSDNHAFAELVTGNVKARVDAAVGSATALGRTAAAALGSINTLANLANITNEEA